MIAWLPLAAATGAPTRSGVPEAIRGETAAQVWDATLTAADDAFVDATERRAPVGPEELASMLSAMWLLLVAWIVWRSVTAARVLNAEQPDAPLEPNAVFSPPRDLEPAAVAMRGLRDCCVRR